MAAKIALECLDEISEKFPVNIDNPETLVETAMTTLSSKMCGRRPKTLSGRRAALHIPLTPAPRSPIVQ